MIDTGITPEVPEFDVALRELIDPHDIRWRQDKVLGTHLPPILGDLDRHVKTLTKLPSSTPYVTADQAALEAFMAEMAPQ